MTVSLSISAARLVPVPDRAAIASSRSRHQRTCAACAARRYSAADGKFSAASRTGSIMRQRVMPSCDAASSSERLAIARSSTSARRASMRSTGITVAASDAEKLPRNAATAPNTIASSASSAPTALASSEPNVARSVDSV